MSTPEGLVGGLHSLAAQGYAGATYAAVFGPVVTVNAHPQIRLHLVNESESTVLVDFGVVKAGMTVGAPGTRQGVRVPIPPDSQAGSEFSPSEIDGIVLGLGDCVAVSASVPGVVVYTVFAIPSPGTTTVGP